MIDKKDTSLLCIEHRRMAVYALRELRCFKRKLSNAPAERVPGIQARCKRELARYSAHKQAAQAEAVRFAAHPEEYISSLAVLRVEQAATAALR